MKDYLEESTLINNIVKSIVKNDRIGFLIGAGVSASTSDSKIKNGIGDSNYFIKLFRKELKKHYKSDPLNCNKIINHCENQKNKYTSYALELGKTTNDIGNVFKEEIMKIGGLQVLQTTPLITKGYESIFINEKLQDISFCENINLNKGIDYFGKTAKFFSPKTKIITPNIDPFLEISLIRNDVEFKGFEYSSNNKSTIKKTVEKEIIEIEHYHGYWLSKGLHTFLNENSSNETNFTNKLKSEIDHLFVIGYAGWDDSMSLGIKKYLETDRYSGCKIHWCLFKESSGESDIFKNLNEENMKGRVLIYKNIDSNIVFPKLYEKIKIEYSLDILEDYYRNKILELDKDTYSSFSLRDSNLTNYTFGGNLKNRKDNTGKEPITRFIEKTLLQKKHSVIICSKFGLGKTTVLKGVFKNILDKDKNIYPVFLSLRNKRLNLILKQDESNLNLIDFIIDEIKETSDKHVEFKFFELLKNTLNDFIKEGNLILILDGIDESIHKRKEFKQLKEGLKGLDFYFLSSIRTEFHHLIDDLINIENFNHVAIEINEWNEDTLSLFLDSSTLKENQKKQIENQYSNLSKRPLFLNLLLYLKSQDEQIEVLDNISDLYSKFLDYTVDYQIKKLFGSELVEEDLSVLDEEYKDLLIELAIAIYLENRHYIDESENDYLPKITFNEQNYRLLISKYKKLSLVRLKKIIDFEEDTKFKIIVNAPKNQYTFFHRSFFEYLVAKGAARSIFRSQECSNAWSVYQTDEVSNYFVLEVENYKKNCGDKKFFYESIIKSYLKELSELDKFFEIKDKDDERYNSNYNLFRFEFEYQKVKKKTHKVSLVHRYSEKLEEVLFYIGKHLVDSTIIKNHISEEMKDYREKILRIIDLLLKYKRFFPPTYFRTASITKSKLENDISYIYTYLSRILLDLNYHPRTYYRLQKEKDREYYGLETLYEKALESVNKILDIPNKEFSKINPLHLLKVFSFFVSLDSETFNDYKYKYSMLNALKNKSSLLKDEGFSSLLDGIEFVLARNDFKVIYSNTLYSQNNKNFIECVEIALKKRDLEQNIIRLFNSTGDGLDGLYIDLYNNNVVILIEFTILSDIYYLNSIVEILKSNLPRLKSVYLKYSWWFDDNFDDYFLYNSNINKNKIDIFDCKENELKILINPKGAKTGFFIDNRKIREFISNNSEGKDILNLCAFTSTLGALARLNKANKVVNVELYEENINLSKLIYKENNLEFKDDEFIISSLEDYLKAPNQNEKYDIVILDLPEYAAIPAFIKNIEKFYLTRNLATIKLLKKGGLLITSCCSHGFTRKRFDHIINELETNHGLKKLDISLDKLHDHPIDDNKVNDYLKINILQKNI